MKRESVNYFWVGLFVLTGLAVLLYVMFRLLNGAGERDPYYTYYRNVAGVTIGTLVTYEGFAFGHVSAVRPQRNEQGIRYQVELQVSKDWKIPVDSVARIYSEGLLADFVVNISEGESAEFLAPGGELKGEQGTDLFASIGAVAGDFSDLSENAIRPMIETLNHTVQQVASEIDSGLPEIMKGMQELVVKLDQSATHLSGILNEKTEAQVHRTLDNIEETATDFRSMTGQLVEVQQEAQTLIRKLDSLVTESRPDIQKAVTDLRYLLEQVSRYSDGILQNLDSTSRNVNELSRQIRENPRRLLGSSAPKDTGVSRD